MKRGVKNAPRDNMLGPITEMVLIVGGWVGGLIHATRTVSKFISPAQCTSRLMASGKIGHSREFCTILGRFAPFSQLNAAPMAAVRCRSQREKDPV